MKTRFTAFFLALVLLVSTCSFASALEGEAERAADTLQTLGLVNGTGSGYDLDSELSRAQAAVLLVRVAGAQQAAAADPWFAGFRDLPAWAVESINYAAHQGWVSGTTILDFSPNASVTANAWCAMLLRMLGYRDSAGDFTVEDAALFAQHIGLTSRAYSGTLTRGDVFEILCDALTFPYRDGSGTVIGRLVSQGNCSRSAANALGLLTTELTARQVADRHLSAVFCLDTYATEEAHRTKEPTSNASGFFISADGLAVTNYHSIDGALYATATLSTGEVYDVEKVIYYDVDIDVAVLQISRTSATGKKTSVFSFLDVVGTGDIRPGDTVYTLGNPLGLGLAVSSGIISANTRDVERYALPCVMNTADISQGSSGGALLNVYGQVVAITSGAFVYGNNMYLAVPADPLLSADLTVSGLTLRELTRLQATKAA